MNEDFRDLLAALLAVEARFLVVGAHALAVHGAPRATGDLDVWVESTPGNAARVWEALERFGAPIETLGVTRADLQKPGRVVQIGIPPRRIDIITEISGVTEFAPAWQARVVKTVEELEIPFLDRETLLRNKRAAGRPQDVADVAALERLGG